MTKKDRPSFQNRVGYHAGLLGGFATMAAALLVIGNIATRDAIAQREAEDMRASLSQVIPATIHDNNLLDDLIELKTDGETVDIYRAKMADNITAVAYRIVGYGYSGKIVLMLGVDATGKILGVRVLTHAETPGLGDKIETSKDDWIYSFDKLSLDNTPDSSWAVKKDGGQFDQFSGATITPRAVVKAVKAGLDFFRLHQVELLNPGKKFIEEAN